MTVDLLAERRNRGLSQAQMARAVGVTRRVWQLAESGSEPRGESAVKIADFLRLRVIDVWPSGRSASASVKDAA